MSTRTSWLHALLTNPVTIAVLIMMLMAIVVSANTDAIDTGILLGLAADGDLKIYGGGSLWYPILCLGFLLALLIFLGASYVVTLAERDRENKALQDRVDTLEIERETDFEMVRECFEGLFPPVEPDSEEVQDDELWIIEHSLGYLRLARLVAALMKAFPEDERKELLVTHVEEMVRRAREAWVLKGYVLEALLRKLVVGRRLKSGRGADDLLGAFATHAIQKIINLLNEHGPIVHMSDSEIEATFADFERELDKITERK